MSRPSFFMKRRRERGASLIVILGAMIPAIGVTAFVVDYGRFYVTSNELRNVSDSAALAAVSNIDSLQNDGQWNARWADACADATLYATSKNKIEGAPLVAGDVEVAIGFWDTTAPRASAFNVLTTCPSTPTFRTFTATQMPSVRVLTHRAQGKPSGPLTTFFGSFVGVGLLNASGSSVASVARADRITAVPMGMAQCLSDTLFDSTAAGNIKPAFLGYKVVVYQGNVNQTNDITCSVDAANRTIHVPAQWAPLCVNAASNCSNGMAAVTDRLSGRRAIDKVSIGDRTEVRDGAADSTSTSTYFRPLVDNGIAVAAPIIKATTQTQGQTTTIKNFDQGSTGEIIQFVGLQPLTSSLVKKRFPGCTTNGCTQYDTLEFTLSTAIDFDARPDNSGSTSGTVLTNPFLVL